MAPSTVAEDENCKMAVVVRALVKNEAEEDDVEAAVGMLEVC